jgi:hypothetical protein
VPPFDAPPFDAPPFDAPPFDAPPFEAPPFEAPPFEAPPLPESGAPPEPLPPEPVVATQREPMQSSCAAQSRAPRHWAAQTPDRHTNGSGHSESYEHGVPVVPASTFDGNAPETSSAGAAQVP